ncbi:hypothetical protein O9929_11280 [Vibrio lentus]|nr:hypothetical protein [Vibrio lentus]
MEEWTTLLPTMSRCSLRNKPPAKYTSICSFASVIQSDFAGCIGDHSQCWLLY